MRFDWHRSRHQDSLLWDAVVLCTERLFIYLDVVEKHKHVFLCCCFRFGLTMKMKGGYQIIGSWGFLVIIGGGGSKLRI